MDHDVPLAILVEAVERVLAITMLIFANPRRTVSTTDRAHGVEGFAGDGVGQCSSDRQTLLLRITLTKVIAPRSAA